MAKYVDRRYVVRREDGREPCRAYAAVRGRDITSLLQLYAEGEDLAKPLRLPDGHKVKRRLHTDAAARVMLFPFLERQPGSESD